MKAHPTQSFFALAVVLCFLLSMAASQAKTVLIPLTPGAAEVAGLLFESSAEKLPEGATRFRVVVTEKDGSFGRWVAASLSRVKLRNSSWSMWGWRELIPSGKPQVYEFTVSRKELNEPNLCFVFTNTRQSRAEVTPSPDIIYLPLKDFPAKG